MEEEVLARGGEGWRRERRRGMRRREREEGISLRLLLLDLNDYITSLFIVLSRLVS